MIWKRCKGEQKYHVDFEFKYAEAIKPEMIAKDEEWRQIPHTNTYVSYYGRYMNHLSIVVTPNPKSSGYCVLRANNKFYQMHREIAIAFKFPETEYQNEVDHIDRNPSHCL